MNAICLLKFPTSGDVAHLSLKFGWKTMQNIVNLGFMSLATEPTRWSEVSSFKQGPSLAKLVLKILGKEMAKEEQCSDWSIELTKAQITCEYSVSFI